MSSVIEINSSDDERDAIRPIDADEVVVLSGQISETANANNNKPKVSYNIDLTNDSELCDLIEDLSRTNNCFTEEFLKFLRLIYDLESSDGMKRIITKKLVPSYTKADKKYIESKRFKKFILNSIYKLNTSPNRKFSHLKEVCDVLKAKDARKRAQLLSMGRKRNIQPSSPSKRQRCETIDLDQLSDEEEPSDVIVLNDEKENQTEDRLQRVNTKKYKRPDKNKSTNFHQLLTSAEETSTVHDQIIMLEARIESRKKRIEELEMQEVNLDDETSPYIVVDGLKAELVILYKQLCALKGEDCSYKTKQIKLHPVDGRHPGPSQKLEAWLNSHTEENGMPQFPDLFDVVQCVTEASIAWGLNWEKQMILNEARLLFTQCGRALQRRRQKREWRELQRAADADPAEQDEALRARLEENSRLARTRETAILEHYVSMDEKIKEKRHTRRVPLIAETSATHVEQPQVTPQATSNPTLDIPSTSIHTAVPSFGSPSTFQDALCNFILSDNYNNNNNKEKLNVTNVTDTVTNTTNKEHNIVENVNSIQISNNETNKQDVAPNHVQSNIVLPNNFAAIQRLNNYIESQMDNENNTNIELDRIGNVETEIPIENNEQIKQEHFDELENADEGIIIEENIPVENSIADINDELEIKVEQEENSIEATIKPEIDIIEETETVVGMSHCENYQENILESTNECENKENCENDKKDESKDSLLNNTNTKDDEIKVKTEIKMEKDETLKLMLEFDEDIVDTRVFLIDEPVVFIEISSSEDEDDSDLEYVEGDGDKGHNPDS